MKKLKTLALSISLMLMLAGAALADEANTPPCSPGEMNGPPCPSSQLVADESSNQTGSSIADEVETLTITTAISAIENLLTVY